MIEVSARDDNWSFNNYQEHGFLGSQWPTLIKLHGSCGETAKEDSIFLPGSEKTNASQSELRAEWHFFSKQLEAANDIKILGYSMPPSDAFARDKILTAIARNEGCKIDLVLGRIRTPGVDALEAVFRLLGKTVTVWPLNAEEYIHSYSRV